MNAPISLLNKLESRKAMNAFRHLRLPTADMVDFCSNDYLGIVKHNLLQPPADALAKGGSATLLTAGATGSRLLAGNYALIEEAEKQIAAFHQTPAALIFNSGYDANVGLLSSVPQKGDTVIYDSLSHASIRDGIRLSFAQAFSFAHNNMEDLEKKLQHASGAIYVVTESVFSMDGDVCLLDAILTLCEQYGAYLIVDEAHATGVIGDRGEGLSQQAGLENKVFARVHTFGKACGCHGAAVVGSQALKDYLVNFARSFIYTTALPPHAAQFIRRSYQVFPTLTAERAHLRLLVQQFQHATLAHTKLASNTPIQVVMVPGNEAVKRVADKLAQNNLDIRPILYPTVPKGKERLRIVLHAFNAGEEVEKLVSVLQ